MGCAALLGASIAFPLGILVGGYDPPRQAPRGPGRPAPTGGQVPTSRNVYSPRIASDPYVIAQQREVLRALESSCRQFDRHCEEAGQARLRLEEAEAGR
jgi:hypothetical protein